jgi:DNA helicase HerA-like ATPase
MMSQSIGRVISVSGSRATARLEADEGSVWIGAMVKIQCPDREVVGTVSALQSEDGPPPRASFVVDLFGELTPGSEGGRRFARGLSHYPLIGAAVRAAGKADVEVVYTPPAVTTIRLGTFYQERSRPAPALMDELLAKHFAVVGTTGSGKSCAVTVILSAILDQAPDAHIILLDPHNEYTTVFGERAEVIDIATLQLPLWLLNLEEAVRVLVRGGDPLEQQAQEMILRDAITRARRHYAGEELTAAALTVDAPVPYRVFDLLRFIYDAMGKLDKPDTSIPYQRLRTRLESLRDDRRYAFMFSEKFVVKDAMAETVGRLLRIPGEGKPLSIVDLSGIPSEVVDVIVSLFCRIIFDFALWCDQERMPPILLVCEEAHRYVPADPSVGFAAAARAITQIAKEGRKYRVSLALVSQRPSELSPEALAQCGTVFALRLANDADFRFVANLLPEAAQGMLAALPSLETQEAIVSGQGVPLPTRIRFDDLPPERRPRSEAAVFSSAWSKESVDSEFVEEAVRRWRAQSRGRPLV